MKNFLIACFLVFLAAAPAVFAMPPNLAAHLVNLPIVHDKTCRVPSLGITNQECLIYAAPTEFWIVLYDSKIEIERVIMVKDGKEFTAWCRPTVCV